LADLNNRRRESWVLDAMTYLNHPLRSGSSIRYLEQSLTLAAEIKRTGDIFFPLAWLSAAQDGHQSRAAADIVAHFLRTHQTLEPRLRGKMLQAADGLFRAAAVVDQWRAAP
jgi:aminopeptidase N